MKITDVETFVVATPPPHRGGRVWIFVKLTTDNGLVGYGLGVELDEDVARARIRRSSTGLK